jgi:hypothetical protein
VAVWQTGRLPDHLDAFAAFKRLDCGAGRIWVFILPKISPWDDNIVLFGFKIGWDITRAFLTEAVLMILLPDFLDSGGDSNLILLVLLVF